jgi:hypothetical protein
VKIYIAGKWEEHDLIKIYADCLRTIGHEITFPWFERHLGNTPLNQGAIEDLQGVLDSELSIFIFERYLPYSGAMSELGAALATNKRIIVVGDGGKRNIFSHHPRVEHKKTFEEVITWLTSTQQSA